MTDSRERLFAATIASIAEKGYAAATVDEICARAGVTKGAFFHHFPSKQSLTVAAVNYWAEKCDASYAAAPYQKIGDPLERLLGYLNFQKDMLRASTALTGSVVGLLIREVSETHPDLARACKECMAGQIAKMECDIADAAKLYSVDLQSSTKGLALHVHAVLQGTHILAKSADKIDVANESIKHLRRYIEMLFQRPKISRRRKT